ncbi:MAG: DNA polymerase III subunit delta, partial [Pseudomonadota bacterium]
MAARFCADPKPGTWAFLIFGEDEGVVLDAAIQLRTALVQRPDTAEFITLDEDELRKDASILFDALEARSLLGNERVIRLRTNTERLSSVLLEAIAIGETDANRFDTRLIITAGGLAKRSKLRATIEGALNAVALHFYNDEADDLEQMVRQSLASSGVRIEDEALSLWIGDLPGHRGLANQELEKLQLYGYGLGRTISIADIRALSTVDADHALTDIVQAALAGQPGVALEGLDRLAIAGTSPITILRALQREATRLLHAHALAGTGGDIGMKLRPPVFKQ